MRKSTIIATCLVNSGLVQHLEEAELVVLRTFRAELPTERFGDWDTEVEDSTARDMIKNVGRASQISIPLFIEDLRGLR